MAAIIAFKFINALQLIVNVDVIFFLLDNST